MKLFFTITIMGLLTGLLVAGSCDDVNDENYPDVEKMNRYRRQGIADEKLKEYRQSLCENEADCFWMERPEQKCIKSNMGMDYELDGGINFFGRVRR